MADAPTSAYQRNDLLLRSSGIVSSRQDWERRRKQVAEGLRRNPTATNADFRALLASQTPDRTKGFAVLLALCDGQRAGQGNVSPEAKKLAQDCALLLARLADAAGRNPRLALMLESYGSYRMAVEIGTLPSNPDGRHFARLTGFEWFFALGHRDVRSQERKALIELARSEQQDSGLAEVLSRNRISGLVTYLSAGIRESMPVPKLRKPREKQVSGGQIAPGYRWQEAPSGISIGSRLGRLAPEPDRCNDTLFVRLDRDGSGLVSDLCAGTLHQNRQVRRFYRTNGLRRAPGPGNELDACFLVLDRLNRLALRPGAGHRATASLRRILERSGEDPRLDRALQACGMQQLRLAFGTTDPARILRNRENFTPERINRLTLFEWHVALRALETSAREVEGGSEWLNLLRDRVVQALGPGIGASAAAVLGGSKAVLPCGTAWLDPHFRRLEVGAGLATPRPLPEHRGMVSRMLNRTRREDIDIEARLRHPKTTVEEFERTLAFLCDAGSAGDSFLYSCQMQQKQQNDARRAVDIARDILVRLGRAARKDRALAQRLGDFGRKQFEARVRPLLDTKLADSAALKLAGDKLLPPLWLYPVFFALSDRKRPGTAQLVDRTVTLLRKLNRSKAAIDSVRRNDASRLFGWIGDVRQAKMLDEAISRSPLDGLLLRITQKPPLWRRIASWLGFR